MAYEYDLELEHSSEFFRYRLTACLKNQQVGNSAYGRRQRNLFITWLHELSVSLRSVKLVFVLHLHEQHILNLEEFSNNI